MKLLHALDGGLTSERFRLHICAPRRLVGLFKPPEELSALVVMELLYYYALAHQDSFDVRWIKNGTVADSLIQPLAERLEGEHGLIIKGGTRVTSMSRLDDGKISLEYSSSDSEETENVVVDGW